MRIKNFMLFDSYELDMSHGAVLRGGNGVGKTSIMKAIQTAFGQGTNFSRLIREGEEKAEVVLVMDDGVIVERTIKKNGTSLKMMDRFGDKIAKPAEVLKDMIDPFGLNPVSFITATTSQRTELLKGLLDAPAEEAGLDGLLAKARAVSGFEDFKSPGRNAFEDLDTAEKLAFDLRRYYDRTREEKKASVKNLEGSTAGIDLDLGVIERDKNEARIELDRINESKTQQLLDVSESSKKASAEIDARYGEEERDVRAKIEALRARLDGIERNKNRERREIESRESARREEIIEACREEADAARQRLAAVEENENLYHRYKATLQEVELFKRQFDESNAAYEILHATVAAVREKRKELMAERMPAGLSIENGEVYFEGIPYDTLNTQKQVEIAVELALLRNGGKGFVFLDGIELLDPQNKKILFNRLSETDCQLLCCEVTEGALSVGVPEKPLTEVTS